MIKDKNRFLFEDRVDASKQLIAEIPSNILFLDNVIVLAVSEGGVFFANELAKKLNASLDILLTEHIYSYVNPELAIAMVGETEEIVIHKALTDAFNISKDYIYNEAYSKYSNEILNYIKKYRRGEKLKSLEGKYVILTDESVETGLTMMASVKTAISLGAKNIFIAVPILDNVVYESLVTVCDNIFCPHKIDDYISVEYYYKELEPFSFDKIEEIMVRYLNKNNKGKR